MEPRDFQEVTMNETTKRDAGLKSTIKAMRASGDDVAEDTMEEVLAERQDPMQHPDRAQALLFDQRATLEIAQSPCNQQQGAQQPPTCRAMDQQEQVVAGQPTAAPGQAPQGGLPPAQPGQQQPVEPAGQPPVQTGTLVRQGNVSNQFSAKGKL